LNIKKDQINDIKLYIKDQKEDKIGCEELNEIVQILIQDDDEVVDDLEY
jgi:hypothetical protein